MVRVQKGPALKETSIERRNSRTSPIFLAVDTALPLNNDHDDDRLEEMEEPTGLVSKKSEPSASAVTSDSAIAGFSQEQTVHNPENNIFVAAQRGDVALIRELIESGQAKATDRDDQNITPLHWASINAQVATCRYLLDQGAEVDALGGDLIATPLQWAARNGYLYVIQLLISHNADPTIADSQGYNTLHLVTHSSSVMPLLYLLHQPINVDSRDSQGHTSLMWAAYQGDALSVDLLLKHGASPVARDDAGLTPLHWAVVRANRVCIRRLVEQGGDLTAKDGEGRTPRDMAVELKSLGAWKRALEEGGMNEYGVKKSKPLSDRNTKIAIFVLPGLFFYLIFMTLTILSWYTGILLAMAEFFGMHHIVTRVLLNNSTYTDSVNNTPYFAGIIMGSVIWVLFCWFTRLLQATESHAFTNLTFAVAAGLCVYNFCRAVMLDPGTCPKPASDGELKSIIEDLAMGVNNHRQFVLFVLMLVIGIGLFDYLVWQYFAALPIYSHTLTPITPSPPRDSPPNPNQDISPSCFLPTDLCLVTQYDTFLVSVTAWATLQLSWTIVLLASQFWQIVKQMTTLEVVNLGRYGFMGGRGGQSMQGQMGHSHSHSHGRGRGQGQGQGDSEDAALMGGDSDSTPGTPSSSSRKHKHGCSAGSGFLMHLVGFDRFTKGKAVDGLARAQTAANPFDAGVWGNCKDFWTAGRELGVEYDKLYDVPVEGFVEAKRRREREEGVEWGERDGRDGHGRKASAGAGRKGMFMGLNIGRAGSSRGGYEPLSQV
ncbi:palmitoyltransferase akr1 [Marasmius crinis-equi]|uniref:Palmitoyltransferase n=1 Tax=Marasmius crinis-equi TaxID=585013 RepID=A0ABR3EVX1_9AGAR